MFITIELDEKRCALVFHQDTKAVKVWCDSAALVNLKDLADRALTRLSCPPPKPPRQGY